MFVRVACNKSGFKAHCSKTNTKTCLDLRLILQLFLGANSLCSLWLSLPTASLNNLAVSCSLLSLRVVRLLASSARTNKRLGIQCGVRVSAASSGTQIDTAGVRCGTLGTHTQLWGDKTRYRKIHLIAVLYGSINFNIISDISSINHSFPLIPVTHSHLNTLFDFLFLKP